MNASDTGASRRSVVTATPSPSSGRCAPTEPRSSTHYGRPMTVPGTAAAARPAGTFSSLRNRNFRLYYIGQGISTAGTFMQAVGQSWLVLKLTGSGTALGIVTMLQFLPLLVFGGYAGVIVDRYDRRRLYIITQSLN